MMAVYKGAKAHFPNYGFFTIDGSERPQRGIIRGQRGPELGELLQLRYAGLYHSASGTFGWEFHGNYGIVALDNGYYYVAEGKRIGANQDGDVYLYRWTGTAPTPFERVTTQPSG